MQDKGHFPLGDFVRATRSENKNPAPWLVKIGLRKNSPRTSRNHWYELFLLFCLFVRSGANKVATSGRHGHTNYRQEPTKTDKYRQEANKYRQQANKYTDNKQTNTDNKQTNGLNNAVAEGMNGLYILPSFTITTFYH